MNIGHLITVYNRHGRPLHSVTVITADDAHAELCEWIAAIGLEPWADDPDIGSVSDAVYSLAEYGNPRPLEEWVSPNGTRVTLQPVVLPS
jgi:hypothetical protein